MGCDIHAYIEYRKKGRPSWWTFGNRINPGRNYAIFGRLAEVRTDGPAVAPVRGFPADAATTTLFDNTLYVSDEHANQDGFCSRAEAEKWGRPVGENRITNPDWHSHSWVTVDELGRALQAANEDYPGNFPVEWQAVFDAMKSFERQGCEVRLVFWFDN